MLKMAAPKPLTSIEVPAKLRRRFYEAVKFEEALITASTRDPESPGRVALDVVAGPEVSADDAFRSFVNKLAHVCDIKKGGTTVSAISVLQDPDGVHYFVGSNNRQKKQSAEVEAFLRKLLQLPTVGVSSGSPKRRADLFDSLFLHITKFNQPRLKFYLKVLDRGLNDCISNLDQTAAGDTRDHSLKAFLLQLRGQIKFHTAEKLREDEAAFSAACAHFIRTIHDALPLNGLIAEAILRQSRENQINSSKLWLDLRHVIARLRAYFVSAETIMRSSERWSDLFVDFQITVVPSNSPHPNPLKKTAITACEMIGRMASNPKDIADRRADAERLQKFSLDAILQEACAKDSFTPLVHAEILVYDSVQKYITENSGVAYWNDISYVGSSKPTCRLCHYYFSHVVGVSVRETHANLYPNWRLPDVFDPESAKERDDVMNKITQRIRMDAFNTMKSKLPQGKNNDSSSFPTVPHWFKKDALGNGSVSELSTMLESVTLRTKSGGTAKIVSTVEEDDDDGGGVLLFSGRQSLIAAV